MRLFEIMRDERFAVIGSVIAVACLLPALVAVWMWTLPEAEEDKILKDLRAEAEGRPSQNYISTFELICFTQRSDVRAELSEEAQRLAASFSRSVNACEDSACCRITSPHGVTIALIKGGTIRCLDVHFSYWLAKSSLTCMAPSSVRAEQVTRETAPQVPGGSRFTPGRPQFLMTEERE
jgi:hypothetical protein